MVPAMCVCNKRIRSTVMSALFPEYLLWHQIDSGERDLRNIFSNCHMREKGAQIGVQNIILGPSSYFLTLRCSKVVGLKTRQTSIMCCYFPAFHQMSWKSCTCPGQGAWDFLLKNLFLRIHHKETMECFFFLLHSLKSRIYDRMFAWSRPEGQMVAAGVFSVLEFKFWTRRLYATLYVLGPLSECNGI
jgi:hypothetical protein